MEFVVQMNTDLIDLAHLTILSLMAFVFSIRNASPYVHKGTIFLLFNYETLKKKHNIQLQKS